MGRYDATKQTINANIKQNGSQEITGQIMNFVLNEMVSAFADDSLEQNSKIGAINGILQPNTTEQDITSNFLGYTYSFSETTIGNVSIPEGGYYGFRGGKFEVKTGEVYILTGQGGIFHRLYCLVNKDNVIQQISAPDAVLKDYSIPVENDGYLYVACAANHDYSLVQRVTSSNVINNMQKDISNIGNSIEPKHYEVEDFTKMATDGFYTYSSLELESIPSVSYNYANSFVCVAIRVKSAEKYIISGLGGAGARLYCLVNNEGRIKAIADVGEEQNGLELSVKEDGTLYCTFNKIASYQLIRKYVDNRGWEKGSYEFGKGCDCNYTAPLMDGWIFPEIGQRAKAIYQWYDELVAEFPQYVSKVDCDTPMATHGIVKPEAIRDLPIYMYRFLPPRVPNSSGFYDSDTDTQRIKALILTGTHYEYMGVWSCLNAMRQICRNWKEDRNLEELRWNADLYVIPCFNVYGINFGERTNENGVDLNRNAPTADWRVVGEGTITYSGSQPGSEYSIKVLQHYLEELKPQIFIDHHNTTVGVGDDEGDGKNLIYTHCVKQIGLDVAGVLISQMTRKWKMRFTDTFPSVDSDNTLFGFTAFDDIPGTMAKYATEQGVLGSIYECNRGILYKDGKYSASYRQHDTPLVATCATEGFVNYLVRMLKTYSEQIGVK